MKDDSESKEKANVKKKVEEKKLINHLIFLGGFISLILGVIGIVIPILPTTPFLLHASAAFAKTSKRFHRWLLNNRVLGTYIRYYKEGKGMPLKIKLITLVLLWITIANLYSCRSFYSYYIN